MKIAIMQPYFFPYIGYFQLINAVDKFILLDTVQFIRHGWIERNRVLKNSNEWLYIKSPLLKHSRETLIKDIYIRKDDWQKKILAQLITYKKQAPFYKEVIDLLYSIFLVNTDNISFFNFNSLCKISEYLNISTPIEIFSNAKIEIEQINDSGDWALNISKSINATHYINPIGGVHLFDKKKFEDSKIKLSFLKTNEITYTQFDNEFVPYLSIIDVLMFNSKEQIIEMLKEYTLV